MPEYGVTENGFRRKPYGKIRDDMLEDAREVFGPDWNLGRDSVIGLVIRSVAFGISRLWAVLGILYNAPYIRIASGKNLDLAADYTGIDRKDAEPAEGMVTLAGNAGTTVPAGTRVGKADDSDFPVFKTDNEVTVRSATGEVDAFVTAVEPGEEGNVGAGSVTDLINPIGGINSVDNNKETDTLTVGDDANATVSKTVDVQEANVYQEIAVSDIQHDIFVTGFTFRVENTASSSENYRIRFRLLDDSDGSVIRELGNEVFTLDPGEHDITFDGFEADVREADNIRLELFLKSDSDGALNVILDDSDNYGNGDFVIGGTTQTGQDLVLDFTSETLGDFRRGRDVETDQELRDRYFRSLARGGAGTVAAIESGLINIDDVREVIVDENVTDSTANGLPPHSFRATVQGGTNTEVAETIAREKPAGIEDDGSTTVQIEDEQGNLRSISFTRPTEVTIEFSITVQTDETFPSDGPDLIEDAVVDYVGGTNNSGDTVSGRGIGEDIIQSKVIGAVVSVEGVDDASVDLAEKGNTLDTNNVTIGSDELGTTKPGEIALTVN